MIAELGLAILWMAAALAALQLVAGGLALFRMPSRHSKVRFSPLKAA